MTLLLPEKPLSSHPFNEVGLQGHRARTRCLWLPGWAETVLCCIAVRNLSLLSVDVLPQREGKVKAKSLGSLRMMWESSTARGRVQKGETTIRDKPQWHRGGNSNPQHHLSHTVWLPYSKSCSTPSLGFLFIKILSLMGSGYQIHKKTELDFQTLEDSFISQVWS